MPLCAPGQRPSLGSPSTLSPGAPFTHLPPGVPGAFPRGTLCQLSQPHVPVLLPTELLFAPPTLSRAYTSASIETEGGSLSSHWKQEPSGKPHLDRSSGTPGASMGHCFPTSLARESRETSFGNCTDSTSVQQPGRPSCTGERRCLRTRRSWGLEQTGGHGPGGRYH